MAGLIVENTFMSVEDMVSRVLPPLGAVIGSGEEGRGRGRREGEREGGPGTAPLQPFAAGRTDRQRC